MFSDWLKEGFLLAAQLDLKSAFNLFWPLFLFDLPRFFLSTLAVGLTWALVPQKPAPSRINEPVSVLLVGHNEGDRLAESIHNEPIKAPARSGRVLGARLSQVF